MNDLIRRKDAIDALGEEPIVWEEWTDEYNNGMRTLWAVAKRDIESLPSIDAVPQWIPCSERLPEEGIVVVTVDKDGDYEINAIIDEEDCEWFWEKPVAWMPLPKPYERKES